MEKEFVESEDGTKYEMVPDPLPFRVRTLEDAQLMIDLKFSHRDFPPEKLLAPGMPGYEDAPYEVRYLIKKQ